MKRKIIIFVNIVLILAIGYILFFMNSTTSYSSQENVNISKSGQTIRVIALGGYSPKLRVASA